MNNLQIFNNDQFGQIRTFMQNGEPWFVAKDISNILGYQNSSKAINDHVDIDDKLNNETLSSLGQLYFINRYLQEKHHNRKIKA